MRFDLRAPDTGAPTTDLYAAALDIAAWAETRGCVATVLCEHHMSSDGYLPTPMIVATAMAARTSTLRIMIAVVLLPLYDPIRLAEEMAVVDIVSNGRVSYVAAIGYRPEEYEMYGVDFHRRGKIAEEKLRLLLQAKTGEPFEYEGRHIHVTPTPVTPGGPKVAWGGGSIAAARRAGRFGIGFQAHTGGSELCSAYEEAAREAGHEPSWCSVPRPGIASNTFVAEDVDAAWEELGPYLMHDVRSYAAWNQGTGVQTLSYVQTAEELRKESRSHRILTVGEAVAQIRGGEPLHLHPLIGGLPPEIAWRYLETIADKVMPAVADAREGMGS